MKKSKLYEIIRDIANALFNEGTIKFPFPKEIEDKPLEELGMGVLGFSEMISELEERFQGRRLNLDSYLSQAEYHGLTLVMLLEHLESLLMPRGKNPVVVYVDDEEENIFVFKRKFGKVLNLVSFTDPKVALEYIRTNPDVRLVITDESMPVLTGNMLCDEVHAIKPGVRFILVTGNPNNDDNLMYKSLRRDRFYEFINKPVDLDGKGQEYLAMIRAVLDHDD